MNLIFLNNFSQPRPPGLSNFITFQKLLRYFNTVKITRLIAVTALTIIGLASRSNAAITEVFIDNFKYNGHYYKAFSSSSQLTWSEARVYALSTGGDLTSLNTSDENTFVFSKIGTSANFGSALWVQSGGDYFGPYIGLFQDPLSTGTNGWNWVDNTSLNYDAWQPPQPDNTAGDNVAFYYNNTSKWGDTKNLSSSPYLAKALIVEYDSIPTPAPAPFLGVLAAMNWARRLRRHIKINSYTKI